MNTFAAYILDSHYTPDILQSKTCNEYVKIVHSTSITEYRNWKDLISNIKMHNNLVIFAYYCLGNNLKDIIAKIDELRQYNPQLKLYSIMDQSWYEGEQETLHNIHISDHTSFQYENIINWSLIKEKGLIAHMRMIEHHGLYAIINS